MMIARVILDGIACAVLAISAVKNILYYRIEIIDLFIFA